MSRPLSIRIASGNPLWLRSIGKSCAEAQFQPRLLISGLPQGRRPRFRLDRVMMARAHSATPWGVDAWPVQIEVDVRNGLPQVQIVGLADTAVRESRERVRAAIKNCGFELPPRAVVINLAPADLPQGGQPPRPRRSRWRCSPPTATSPTRRWPARLLCGELGLDGAVRPVRGGARDRRPRRPPRRRRGAGAGGQRRRGGGARRTAPVIAVSSLAEAVGHLTGESPLPPADDGWTAPVGAGGRGGAPDLAEVRGQEAAKRALEVAAGRRPQPAPHRSAGRPARRCSPGGSPASCRR